MIGSISIALLEHLQNLLLGLNIFIDCFSLAKARIPLSEIRHKKGPHRFFPKAGQNFQRKSFNAIQKECVILLFSLENSVFFSALPIFPQQIVWMIRFFENLIDFRSIRNPVQFCICRIYTRRSPSKQQRAHMPTSCHFFHMLFYWWWMACRLVWKKKMR